jgi:hypothetical protein
MQNAAIAKKYSTGMSKQLLTGETTHALLDSLIGV